VVHYRGLEMVTKGMFGYHGLIVSQLILAQLALVYPNKRANWWANFLAKSL
jgi:hypothetical protein